MTSVVPALIRDEPGADKVMGAATSAVDLQEVIEELLLSGTGEPTFY